MALKEKPFWLDTVTIPAGNPSRPLPEGVDVAVVGGGITGLSAARALARRGARVAVLEAEAFGWGASSRNGGMVLSGLKLNAQTLIAKYGRETARRMHAASLAAIDLVEQIVREETMACDFARTGHLEVASKPGHFDQFKRSAELIEREFSHPLRVVSKEQLGEEIGSEKYYGGLVDDVSAGLNPARYVAGLVEAAARSGAVLSDRTRVVRLERETGSGASGFRVTTSRGTVWARDILIATSGYTGPATPSLRKKIIPIGSYILVTAPLPEALRRAASPRNRMIYDSKHYLHYFRLTPDGRMLFGGRAAFFPETEHTVRRSAAILHRDMTAIFPELKNIPVEYAWGGTLDFAFDTMPHAGKLDGLFYALGYAGHGVAMATYFGTKMAATISGEDDDNPFIGLAFPGAPLGLYNGRPWFLPFAGAWYKLLDWIG
jgi:glycine/D-amino acid oxidase-like deaminating enzyme